MGLMLLGLLHFVNYIYYHLHPSSISVTNFGLGLGLLAFLMWVSISLQVSDTAFQLGKGLARLL